MATFVKLCEQGDLVLYELDDDAAPATRVFFAAPKLVKWWGETLPHLTSEKPQDITPQEQADALMENYVSGRRMQFMKQFKPLRYHGLGVWEMKTTDLRIFGWFQSVDHFVGVAANMAGIIKASNMYYGYCDAVVRFRDALDLDEPKYVVGEDPNDVISNFS